MRFNITQITFLAIASLLFLQCRHPAPGVSTTQLESPTSSLMQAISIVDEQSLWVSGHDATFLQSTNGGKSWNSFQYTAIDSLQFRDLHAFDEEHIVLMSAGSGSLSRIFTFSISDGFTERYVMPHEEGFLNSIAFWDSQTGLAFGDSFNGELFLLKTTDGGKNWMRVNPEKLPAAGAGEGGFAASGACITTRPNGKAWIGTGAGGNARVLFTNDFGERWNFQPTPIVKGPTAGITSIRMLTDKLGSIVGGDLAISDGYTNNIAITNDGGVSWTLANQPITKGGLYGSDLENINGRIVLITCGPNGIDYSADLGQSFEQISTENYWAVELHPSGFGIATGKDGRLLKLLFE